MAHGIDVWMVFQVIGASEAATAQSLEQHLTKLGNESSVTEYTQDIEDIEPVDDPHPSIEKGFSQVGEVEMTVATFADLVDLVINYGPTSVDVMGPQEITMDVGEVRNALNSVAQIMHQFLQAGVGGMMISSDGD